MLDDLLDGRRFDGILDRPFHHADGREEHLAERPARDATCAGRGGEALPRKRARHEHLAAAVHGDVVRADLGVQQVLRVVRMQQQRRAILDVEHDVMVAGSRVQPEVVAGAARRAQGHGILDFRVDRDGRAAGLRAGNRAAFVAARHEKGNRIGSLRHG